jgi:serine protease
MLCGVIPYSASGRVCLWNDTYRYDSCLYPPPPTQQIKHKKSSVEEDGLVYPSAWVDGTQEWENYGVPLTQANSVDIPSSDTFGDCSDPNSFKVAIIDSGLKIDHPDSPCRNVVTDGQTKTNCVGQSFGTSDSWSNPFYSWHGTHVAGAMIARGGNGVGVTSTNPTNNNICWVICRVFDEGGGGATWSTVFSAVAWAIDVHKVRVINMSLSGGYSGQGQQFMDYAEENGVIVVAAAGNSAKYQYEYPSSYENVMSVGALDWKK